MTIGDGKLLQFYEFLGKHNLTIKDFDENKDGAITQSEFVNYFNELNFNLEGVDAVDIFKALDVDKSHNIIDGTDGIRELNALGKGDQENVAKQLAAYEVLTGFVEDKMRNIPSQLTILGIGDGDLKDSVNNSLMTTIQKYLEDNKNMSGQDVKDVLPQVLENAYTTAVFKTSANLVAQKLIENALNTPEVSALNDTAYEDVQKMIDAYVTQRATDTVVFNDLSQISTMINEIEYLISYYFAQAGIGKVKDNGIEKKDKTLLNDIYNKNLPGTMSHVQSAVINHKFDNVLASLSGNYEGLEEYWNQYKEQYKQSLLGEGATFESLNSTEINEDALLNFEIDGVSIRTKMELHLAIKNLSDNSARVSGSLTGRGLSGIVTTRSGSLTGRGSSGSVTTRSGSSSSSLLSGFSAEQREEILANLPYTDIQTNLQKKVLDGSIKTQDDLQKALLEEINAQMSGELASAGSVEDNYKMFQNTTKQIEASNATTAEKIAKLKDAAINFCKGLANKDGGEKILEEILGTTDYASCINGMTPADIKSTVKELYEKYQEQEKFNNSLAEFKGEEKVHQGILSVRIYELIAAMANKLKQAGYKASEVDKAAEQLNKNYKALFRSSNGSIISLIFDGVDFTNAEFGITDVGKEVYIDKEVVANKFLAYLNGDVDQITADTDNTSSSDDEDEDDDRSGKWYNHPAAVILSGGLSLVGNLFK